MSLILAMLFLSFALAFAQGSSIATAAAVSPNGSAGGSMNDASKDHYWKVTTTADGYLRIQITSASTIDIDVTLYDNDGTTFITSHSETGTYSEVFGFLKPGTYYVYARRWTGTSGSYTITSTFASPSRAVDQEPNDTPASALTLGPTGTSTGHVGFYGAAKTDVEDYWSITTREDGWLRVQVRSDSLDLRGDQKLDLDLTMYDINGTSYITSDSRSGTFSQVDAFLRPGTYFVRVSRWTGRGGSYDIKSEFFTPPLANEATEGNDTYQTASTAVINGSVTGHLGYFSNGSTDTQDYWKFTFAGDGKVSVRVTSDSLDRSDAKYDLDLTLFDINGTTFLTSDSRSGTISECIVYLRPGIYFARVNRWTGNGASYTLRITHTPQARANDVEGNDWFASATTLAFNSASTGHLGYYSNSSTDMRDLWRLVAPSSDSIYVHVSSDSTVDLDVTAFAPDSVSFITSDSRSGIYSRVGIKPTAGAAYYFRVNLWTGTAGGYSIIATRSSLAVGVEKISDDRLVPIRLTLDQNYPNPFNPTTTIQYGLPETQSVRITIYSVLGQEIAVLLNAVQSPGSYRVVWNSKDSRGAEMSSGMYFIRLQAGNTQLVRKAMLLR
ncbi:MAG: T9SS type A sorting domain-containing protein [Ignavibacteriales bacterium]|nr:T9SS type A sorting domain-containing protein [Ignavibacteriales bacterium]